MGTVRVEIEPLGEAELAQLFGLARNAFAGTAGWSDTRVLDTLAHDVVFVAHDEGEPAGYVALRREDEVVTVVDQLLVAPGRERRGIGRRCSPMQRVTRSPSALRHFASS